MKSHIVTLSYFKERVVVIYLTLGNLIICSPKQGHSQRIHVHLKGGKIELQSHPCTNTVECMCSQNKSRRIDGNWKEQRKRFGFR